MDTKKLRQKILDLAIHGKLVPQDPNDEPASVLLQRIREEKLRLAKEGKIKRSKKAKTSSDTPPYGNDAPFEVPKGWEWTTVNDISASILYGVSESAKSKGKYKLLRITDIQNNKVEWDNVPFTDFDETKAEAYLLKDGDILFARTGATVGKSYLVKGITEQSIYASYLIRVQIIEAISPDYVKLFFESGFYWEQIQNNSVGIGQPNVNGTVLGNLPIPLPPLAEQRRIVAEVEKWFAVIDKIERGKLELSCAVRQAKAKILDLAIHGKLLPQNPNDEPATQLLKHINTNAPHYDKSYYKNLPQGWEMVEMQTVCDLTDGKKISGREMLNLDVKYLRGEREGKTMTSGKFVAADSLMILVDGENSGEVFRVPIDGYQGSTFKQLVINENMNTDYVLQVIKLNRKALKENKVGSAIPHLNKKLFRAIQVPLPPLSEQQRIVSRVEELFAGLDSIERSLE